MSDNINPSFAETAARFNCTPEEFRLLQPEPRQESVTGRIMRRAGDVLLRIASVAVAPFSLVGTGFVGLAGFLAYWYAFIGLIGVTSDQMSVVATMTGGMILLSSAGVLFTIMLPIGLAMFVYGVTADGEEGVCDGILSGLSMLMFTLAVPWVFLLGVSFGLPLLMGILIGGGLGLDADTVSGMFVMLGIPAAYLIAIKSIS